MEEKFEKKVFESHVHETFQIQSASGETISAELVEVTSEKQGDIESFSVMFRGPQDKPLAHDTYKVEHPDMGELSLFLGSVVTEKPETTEYQAVFTTLPEKK